MSKTITANLQAHLAQDATTLAVCVRIECTDGTIIALTNHDEDITYDGDTYLSTVGQTPAAFLTQSDLSVAQTSMRGILAAAGIDEADVASGKIDHAEVTVFMINYESVSDGPLRLRRGWIGEVTIKDEDGDYEAEVRGLAQALQQIVGRLYSQACRADLGDSRCTVDLVPLTVSGTVTTGIDTRQFIDSSRAEDDDYFRYGLVTWTSGNNAGRSMEVKSFSSGSFVLFLPMPESIQTGDEYDVYPGCDKSIDTCRDTYDNVVNFQGEPYIPGINDLREYRVPPQEN